jgi:hypothetical protein
MKNISISDETNENNNVEILKKINELKLKLEMITTQNIENLSSLKNFKKNL